MQNDAKKQVQSALKTELGLWMRQVVKSNPLRIREFLQAPIFVKAAEEMPVDSKGALIITNPHLILT